MRVLVVEDDPKIASVLQRGLEEEDHAVDVARDGPGAVQMATSSAYGAVILDVMLPVFDGFEVARRVRAAGASVPILMLTGRTSVPDRVQGLDCGADDYLAKPFSLDELSARLRALGRRGRADMPVLVVGDLHLDPTTRSARRGHVELELSPKEFALLELFMRHPGVVLARNRILEQVWDQAYHGESNVVDQYVAYLRRKVDKPFNRADIETLRGVGYRLRASVWS